MAETSQWLDGKMTSITMGLRDKKTYGKNLWGLGLLLGGVYLIILTNHSFLSFLTVLGGFLLFEHIFNFGNFEFWDFIGHEWIGVSLIIITFLAGIITWISLFGVILILISILLNTYWGKDSYSKELTKIKEWIQ